jgi:hypothetical protein
MVVITDINYLSLLLITILLNMLQKASACTTFYILHYYESSPSFYWNRIFIAFLQ